uniref:WAP domain-containing protein n=1 Tax=Meloidogyne hapla TaxID=6305 RepID=A0A1I8BFB7_MELHA
FLSVLLVLVLVTEFLNISARHTPPHKKGTPKPKHETTTASVNSTTEEIENDPEPKWHCNHQQWCDYDCDYECGGYKRCKSCECNWC